MPTYLVERTVIQTFAVYAEDEERAKVMALDADYDDWNEQFIQDVAVVGEADWEDEDDD